MTRKEFVLQIVSDLKENPKAVLRGHGMKAPLLNLLAEREDILGKFAAFAYSTVFANKGKKALQKQSNMQVFAYKNFQEFNGKAREDVQSFMENLSPEDQATFTNKNNIVVMLALPDSEDAGTDEGNITLGKSVMLNFDSAVKKEYKIPGAGYYVIMYGDSAIRPVEAKKAKVRAKVNEKIVAKTKSPSKVKAELIRKAKAKMAAVNNKDKKLKGTAGILGAQLGEVGAYARQLGLSPQASPAQIAAAQREFNRRTTAGSAPLKNARVDLHQREINTIRMRNRILVQKLQDAATAKERANIRFAINKNKEKIEQLKARIGVYQNLSASAIKSKAKALATVNAEIEANLAMGQTITDSLAAALAKLQLPAQQKQQIAQQVIEDIANGQSNVQLAAQQVLQQQLPAQVVMQTPQQMVPAPKKRGRKATKTIEQILNTPVEPVFGGDLVDDNFSDVLSTQTPQFSQTADLKKIIDIL